MPTERKKKGKETATSKIFGFKTAGFFAISVIKVSEKNTTSIIVADNSLQDDNTTTETSKKGKQATDNRTRNSARELFYQEINCVK